MKIYFGLKDNDFCISAEREASMMHHRGELSAEDFVRFEESLKNLQDVFTESDEYVELVYDTLTRELTILPISEWVEERIVQDTSLSINVRFDVTRDDLELALYELIMDELFTEHKKFRREDFTGKFSSLQILDSLRTIIRDNQRKVAVRKYQMMIDMGDLVSSEVHRQFPTEVLEPCRRRRSD